MTVTVQFDVPAEIEKKLRSEGDALPAQIKEAYALDLYRRERLSFYELSKMLGLNLAQTGELLQHHQIYVGALTMEDVDADVRRLHEVLDKGRQ